MESPRVFHDISFWSDGLYEPICNYLHILLNKHLISPETCLENPGSFRTLELFFYDPQRLAWPQFLRSKTGPGICTLGTAWRSLRFHWHHRAQDGTGHLTSSSRLSFRPAWKHELSEFCGFLGLTKVNPVPGGFFYFRLPATFEYIYLQPLGTSHSTALFYWMLKAMLHTYSQVTGFFLWTRHGQVSPHRFDQQF